MNDLHILVMEERRLAILALLADSADKEAGSPMLQLALNGMRYNVAIATVDADLDWLRDAGLVVLRRLGGIYIAGLTDRGLDVARGRTQVSGVATHLRG